MEVNKGAGIALLGDVDKPVNRRQALFISQFWIQRDLVDNTHCHNHFWGRVWGEHPETVQCGYTRHIPEGPRQFYTVMASGQLSDVGSES